jgi:hypothetical protein
MRLVDRILWIALAFFSAGPLPQDRASGKMAKASIVTAWATGVIAVFAVVTAVVGVLQYLTFSDQLAAMRQQVDEMKNQRLLTMEQIRANMRWEQPDVMPVGSDGNLITGAGQSIFGYTFSPRWLNTGSTTAISFVAWFQIRSFERRPPNKKS